MNFFQMTGYFKRCFVNETNHGKVANFFVKSGGRPDGTGGYKSYEYAFETWMKELIEKLAKVPRESLVTVSFEIIPKYPEIEGKKINQNTLKADSVIYWEKPKKENATDAPERQIEMHFPGSD